MPVLPNLIERVLFRTGVAPRPLIDVAAAASFRALQAAMRLGLLETLSRGPRTIDDLAREAQVDPAMLGALLDLLEAAGHVRQSSGRYTNSAATARWLVSGVKGSSAAFVRLWTEVVFDEWDTLEVSLRTGKPATHMNDWLTARDTWRLFNSAMAEFPAGAADAVASAVDLPSGARSIIDLGGAHALYAIAFCRRHSTLRATVFDRPVALEAARENVAAAGLADRVDLRTGDLTTDELGGPYDAALLFQLIHYFDDETLAALLRKVRTALRPAGVAVILDQLTPDPPTPVARAFLRTLALQYRISLGGQLRRFDELRQILIESGYEGVRRKRPLRLPGNEIVSARVGAQTATA